MIKFQNSISIEVPIEKAFDFIAGPENFPHWNYYLKSVTKISEGETMLGARFHQIRKQDEQVFEITQFEQYKLIELTTLPKANLYAKRLIVFSTTGQGTQIEDFFELDSGHPSFLQKLFVGKTKRAIKENLDKLKELLETGYSTLQDGRISRI